MYLFDKSNLFYLPTCAQISLATACYTLNLRVTYQSTFQQVFK